MWAPALPDWSADGEFIPGSDEEGGGSWFFDKPVPRDGWPLTWDHVTFTENCTPFRHLGFFPDMDAVGRWMRGQVSGVGRPQVMSTFGYTGIGTRALSTADPTRGQV